MPSDPFTDVLRQWAEVFMHRSMRDFREFTRKSGLSMSQLNALFHIYHCGGCGVTDIGEHLGVTSAAASQMIDRMVQQGLLERRENAGDRRMRQLSLTAKGHGLVVQAIEARYHWTTQLTAQLTREQQAVIVAGLTGLVEAARQLEGADAAPAAETRARTRAARFEKAETSKHR